MRYRLHLQIIDADKISFRGTNIGEPVYSDTVDGLLKQLPELLKANSVQILDVFQLIDNNENGQYLVTEALLSDGSKVMLDIVTDDLTPPVKFRELVANAFKDVREQVLEPKDNWKMLDLHNKQD